MNTFIKQPAETYTIAVEFAGKLPLGAALSTGVVACFDPLGTDVSGALLIGTTAVIAGTQARIKVLAAGVHGVIYRIRFRVTLDNGDVLEEDVEMSVENL